MPVAWAFGVVKCTQHGIDAGLIASALLLEPVQHIAVQAKRDDLLAGWDRYTRTGPVNIERHSIRVVGNGLCDVLLGHGIKARKIGSAFPALRLVSRYVRS